MNDYTDISEDLRCALAEVETLKRENRNLRNELCLKCGRYKEAHNGACDGCRWRAKPE